MSDSRDGLLRRLMRRCGGLLPINVAGEQVGAVRLFERIDRARDLIVAAPLRRRLTGSRTGSVWPVVPGAYAVGDAQAPVAICTLTSNDLMRPLASISGVAIAGRVYTPNLGIERIVQNLTANPRIRFLLLVGKESPVFHPGQALESLFADGVSQERRIIGAVGHLPVLSNIPLESIDRLRRQVELVDRTGTVDVKVIEREVQQLVTRDPGAFGSPVTDHPREGVEEPAFVPIRPGGKRRPLAYDSKGFFVITLDRSAGDIVVRHHMPDNRPGHEMRGRLAEPMLLGLLRDELVSQLSHAGYLGVELAKAEAALRLGLRYEQDQPLRTDSASSA